MWNSYNGLYDGLIVRHFSHFFLGHAAGTELNLSVICRTETQIWMSWGRLSRLPRMSLTSHHSSRSALSAEIIWSNLLLESLPGGWNAEWKSELQASNCCIYEIQRAVLKEFQAQTPMRCKIFGALEVIEYHSCQNKNLKCFPACEFGRKTPQSYRPAAPLKVINYYYSL